MNNIIGMEISNITTNDGNFTHKYIDSDTLKFYMADYKTNLSESQFFDMVCEYLEMFDSDVANCDYAKIQQTYY